MTIVQPDNNLFFREFLFGPAAIVMVLTKDKENYRKVTDALVKKEFKKPSKVDEICSDYTFDNNESFLTAVDILLSEKFINDKFAQQLKDAYKENKLHHLPSKDNAIVGHFI